MDGDRAKFMKDKRQASRLKTQAENRDPGKKTKLQKMHTTNYQNTFIEIADDCPVKGGEVPPLKGEKKTIANLQFEMLIDAPYKFTSDDVIFQVHALKKEIGKSELEQERETFFSKGQACMRASPLTKRYGWGVHSDDKGRIALYASGTPEYAKFLKDGKVKKVKAMRSSRAE